MIPISHLPWHHPRTALVPLRFLPVEAVVSDYQRERARENAGRAANAKDYRIGERT
jgi:hypothetical protein